MGRERCSVVLAVVLAMLIGPAVPVGAHGPATPESYRWVRAPGRVDNAGPPGSFETTYEPEMFIAGTATAWTPDQQAVIRLGAPHGSVAGPVSISAIPLDPTTVGDLPALHRHNGNAYRITIDAEGWEPVVDVRLVTPYPASGLWLRASDRWRSMPHELEPSGEIVGTVPAAETDVVVVASWTPPTHTWVERLAHAPMLVALACVAAGVGGWALGSRGRRREGGRLV